MASSESRGAAGAAPAPREIPRSRRVLFLSVPFIVFFGLLAGVELVVRATRPAVSPLEVFVRAPEQRSGFVDRYGVSMFQGDPLRFWRMSPHLKDVIWDFTLVSTNSQGLRYPREVGRKKAGAFRIACFGDSVTFGYRVPTVWPETPTDYDPAARPYFELLERALRSANPGREIEVIPYAVPGYSSHQGAAWARDEIPGLEADVVTACYGWNDINLRLFTDRESMSTTRSQVLLRSLMMRSQALIYASMMWQQRSQGSTLPAADRGQVTRVLGN
jgi:hypothetical protein